MSAPMNSAGRSRSMRRLASVSETANHWWQRGGLPRSGWELFFISVFSGSWIRKKETSEEKGYQLVLIPAWLPPTRVIYCAGINEPWIPKRVCLNFQFHYTNFFLSFTRHLATLKWGCNYHLLCYSNGLKINRVEVICLAPPLVLLSTKPRLLLPNPINVTVRTNDNDLYFPLLMQAGYGGRP